LFTPDGWVVEANDELAALLGYQRDQLHGMGSAQLLHAQDRAEGFVSGTAGPQGADVAYRLLARADGRPVYCQLRSAPSVQDDGSVLRVVAFQPVTERLREAEALRNQATDDYLTRLPHRRGVNELLGHLLDNADGTPAHGQAPEGEGAAFQRINDSFGVSLASPLLIAAAARKVHAQHQLREALASGGLELHYQPLVAKDGRVASAEALVRWPHSELGLRGPGQFLPLAEQGEFLTELDHWVLRTALREATNWPAPGGRPVSIAVNLSGLNPDDHGFAPTVSGIIADSGIDPHRVILELVETALIDLPARSHRAMRTLARQGVRFAVDDFGTGNSSLARLKDLPVQIIKTDRRFVAGLGHDPTDLALTKAITDMARALGRQCVAEGVETSSQFQILSGIGVDTYQGWLFSYPLPRDEFRTLLDNGPLKPGANAAPRR
jgi:PAS domain S-box-containing protein